MPEEIVTTWASRKVNRPVKWVNERSEGFLSDAHGRDHVSEAELALDREREVPGIEGAHHRQHGRLPVDIRPEHPDQISTACCLPASTPRPQFIARSKASSPTPWPVDAYRG